jgi:hypothetical protein
MLKLQEQVDREEPPASAFLFEMLRNGKDPWIVENNHV